LVDRVLNVVADADWPTRNSIQITDGRDAVIAGAGSRYSPSSPLELIERVLQEPGRLAFIGKPCDVSALRQFAKIDPRVDEKIPLMLAFFCAGVPSTRGADKVIRSMGLAPEEVRSFRYRGEGWPGSAKAVTADGRTAKMSYADSWGGHLSKEVQFRCKICPDAVGGVADVACADAWYGGETGYPTFEEMDGRSLIITRTGTGEALLSSAMATGAIEAEPLDKDEINLMQPSQVRRKRMMRARRAACHVTGRKPPVVEGLDVGEAAAQAPLRLQLKEFLGTLRRIVREKPPVQTPAAGEMT
jgi:coenzyme F420 hydrogenase subunit beta